MRQEMQENKAVIEQKAVESQAAQAAMKERIDELQHVIPDVESFLSEKQFVKAHLVIFARGGYGRAELGLSSDRDLGYCLDTNRF